ncbi:type II secretion system (T2SS), F family protein [Actinomadura craniellae]|uniref:Type II secretion system (T2SS), F family protein n=1 Tax=Actinomadura craniellae TaxID=2231787 RepID=A0A365H5Q1_9ACTN|nr:type II secretion system F family protein [Actinomadura craniellae]RAY14417.1 type II secretion system (T2SS), F family protein [Actinomadura craniellae]
MFPLAISAGAALCVLLFVWGYHLRSSGQQVPESFAMLTKKSKVKQFGPLGEIINPLGAPFGPALVRSMTPAMRGRIRRRIERAGRPYGLDLDGYARNKMGSVVLFGSVGVFVLLSGQTLFGGLLLIVSLVQTDVVLWNLSQERQQAIEKGLPDFLDVLAVTVSAGLSFRHALARVAESMPGALSQEMMTALRQMEVGTSLREAFEELRSRNNSEALASFVTAILQAEELGAPLTNALNDISVDMRREASQRARRSAQRADPQITMIVTFLMVPAMMALILGMLFYGTGAGGFGGAFG